MPAGLLHGVMSTTSQVPMSSMKMLPAASSERMAAVPSAATSTSTMAEPASSTAATRVGGPASAAAPRRSVSTYR